MIKSFMSLIPKETMIGLFTYSQKSKEPIEKIVNRFEEDCIKSGFALVHQYAYHEVVASKGFPIERKVYIFEICQAKLASMMLTTNPYFSPFMPCRIAVYEESGESVITTQNMEMMLDLIKNQTELHSEAKQLYTNLKSLMNTIGGLK